MTTSRLKPRVAFRHVLGLADHATEIGPRLLAGFLLLILPTVVIGVVAVQRFSSLTATTTELSTKDLPEIVAADRLRALLFQEREVDPASATNWAAQVNAATSMAAQRAALLALEPLDTVDDRANDTALVRSLTDHIARSNDLTWRIQALLASGKTGQASALEQQRAPLTRTLLSETKHLRGLEEAEALSAAVRVRQAGLAATWLVLALTILALPLSLLLALLLARSLIRPLAALLRATKAVAAGDLDASPSVVSGDEIGQLAKAFDAMRSNLRITISALATERQQTQAIIDACADGVILVDEHDKIVTINPAAARLTGWQAREAVGRPYHAVCGSPGDPAGTAADSQEILMHSPSGEERWLAVSRAFIVGEFAAADRRLVVSLHDISQLKVLDQLKSDFVAMVSHELRAPLTTVGSAVEMLVQLDPSADDGAYREVLGILQQQTARLRAVVNEVLQVTRLEAGHLPVRLESLAVVEFLHGLLQRVRQEWAGDERPVRVEGWPGVLVWADRAMLEIVFRNLLDNARKYTPPGSPLEIDVAADPATHRVQLRLTDHGAGIPPNQLDHIFERFWRVSHSASQWTRGYGLGLFIARELLRAHNGE
ncbi:MAG: HAMP domain-containing sensor histidine kinase, partial [Chloroflexota bacterium]